MEEKRIAYKGFEKDLKCRDFQYEVGKEYETDEAVACKTGFHACEMPLAVLGYYPPATSRYCLVEQSGEMDARNGKTASTKLKVCAEIGIPGLVKAQTEWVRKHARSEKSASGDRSVASASGDKSMASNSGDRSVASVSGKASAAMASGIDGRVKGAVGCALFAVERGHFDGEVWAIQSVAAAIVDGEVIKADTWYWCRNGKLVEVDEDAR
nr:MAG TPA: hypothetical protein [Caudoviricetes sp.]